MGESTKLLFVRMENTQVGRLALTPERLAVFEYDSEFLRSGYSISPFYLPLRSGLFQAEREPFEGNFGVFSDSLPDGWGNLLLDRYLTTQGIPLSSLSLLDRLSLIGASGMGALQYFPDQAIQAEDDSNDLNFLATEVEKVLSETRYSQHLKLLVDKGGSPGGARPKVLIHDQGTSWMVKFPAAFDPPDVGQVEYEFSRIARKCGIAMPSTRLFEGRHFGIERFDRIGNQRVHMITASGLLNASHRFPSLDYLDLMKATFALTKDIENCYSLFRLMVFNVLVGNRDDHAKNFSFIYINSAWKLSPAYDLAPNSGFNGNHSTTVAGKGKPGKEHLFEVASQVDLQMKRVSEIYDEVYENCGDIRAVDW